MKKDLICLFTVRKDFLIHFELIGLSGKSENSHGKSQNKQNLTCLPCARDAEIYSCILYVLQELVLELEVQMAIFRTSVLELKNSSSRADHLYF